MVVMPIELFLHCVSPQLTCTDLKRDGVHWHGGVTQKSEGAAMALSSCTLASWHAHAGSPIVGGMTETTGRGPMRGENLQEEGGRYCDTYSRQTT